MIGAHVEVATPTGSVRAKDATVGRTLATFTAPGAPTQENVKRVRYRRATDSLVHLATSSGKEVTLTPDHRVFARLVVTDDLFDVMLVERHGTGFVVGIANGQLRDLTESRTLLERRVGNGPGAIENIWILTSLRDARSASFVEHLLALRHGLPIFDIDPQLRRSNMAEPMLLRLLAALDTGPRATRLLAEYSLDPGVPHFRRRILATSDIAGRQYVQATIHAGSLLSPATQAAIARSHGHPARGVPPAVPPHQIRIVRLSEAIQFDRNHLRRVAPHDETTEGFASWTLLEERLAVLAASDRADTCLRVVLVPPRASMVFPASYVRPGMIVPVLDGEQFTEETVTRADLIEPRSEIYDPGLESSLGLIAGGIVVGTSA